MLKYYLICIARFITRIFRIFPINNNRILFYSFSGKDCSDSPRYIADYISQRDSSYQIIWAVNDPDRWQDLKHSTGWKFIKYRSLAHIYYGSTSKFIVTDTGPYKAIEYRKDQEIINTWHGGGAYKKTGMDNPYKDKYRNLYNKNFGQKGVTLFLSSSKVFTKYAIRGAFGYKGAVAECGLPRNDIFFDKAIIKNLYNKVRCELGLRDKKIVLYAPTWRNYDENGFELIDVNRVVDACKKSFGGQWIFAYRGHNLSNGIHVSDDSDGIVNLTSYPDMQKLLIAADVLISDYSSCIWDYSLLMKPCFLFTPDLEKYVNTFAFYTPIEKWGFDVCRSNSDLEKRISRYSDEVGKQKIEENHLFFGNTETGEARERVYKYITSRLIK